jgi:hypothetical protein
VNEHRVANRDRVVLSKEPRMTVSTLLLILLVLALFAAIPAWPHSRSWGYYPSGGIGIVLLIVLIMVFSGRI